MTSRTPVVPLVLPTRYCLLAESLALTPMTKTPLSPTSWFSCRTSQKKARWNKNGTVLALSGTARATFNKSGQSRDLSVVKMYSPYGIMLRTLKVLSKRSIAHHQPLDRHTPSTPRAWGCCCRRSESFGRAESKARETLDTTHRSFERIMT